MTIIRKKIWQESFDLISSGKKKFEIRLADFDVAEGDTLILSEWDPNKKKFTGRSLRKVVTYARHFMLDDYGQKKEIESKGLYVIQFE